MIRVEAVWLGVRWRTIETSQLEEAAVVIWADLELRCLPPDKAAERWLSPVCAPLESAQE